MTEANQYIGGRWLPGCGQELISRDPATGVVTWRGGSADIDQVYQAVTAAGKALEDWATLPITDRVEYLKRFGRQLTEHRDKLARMISLDTAKPRWEALAEVGAMIGKIGLSIQAYQERRQPVSLDLEGVVAATRYKPHGVCGVLGPFNLPGHLSNGHIVPALLAGNTVVFKPSEQTPAVGEAMVRLWESAELPAGVINLVQGGADVGEALAIHQQVNGLFFTGSFAAGRALAKALAEQTYKILALEMGGNNPLVVWSAADLDAAAYLTIESAYITAGQRCSCARRLIVARDRTGDDLIDRLTRMIHTVRVGSPTDNPEPFCGPVISDRAGQHLLWAQQDLCRRGARPIVEMTTRSGHPAMLTPGLIDVTDVATRGDEEWFGPLLQLIRVEGFDDAIDEANRTSYGLSAALFSDDPALYERFYRRVRAGVINWNRQTTGASGRLPFGGIGASGNHRPSGYWAADYCSYPVASIERPRLQMPSTTARGIDL